MEIVIHNLLRGSHDTLSGDAVSLFRHLEDLFPWATKYTSDLDHALAEIDRHPFLAVEVKDGSPHPFLKE